MATVTKTWQASCDCKNCASGFRYDGSDIKMQEGDDSREVFYVECPVCEAHEWLYQKENIPAHYREKASDLYYANKDYSQS